MSNADILAQNYPDLLIMPEFDQAVIGVCDRIGQDTIVAYDRDLIVSDLMEQGCTIEEALEHFQFNIEGAFMGDKTPCFITFLGELC